MSREIKFRAWYIKEERMIQNIQQTYDSYDEDCFAQFIDKKAKYHVMQYTGLKDKNGVEIYEGDLIKGHNLPIGDNPAEVCWLQNSLSYQVDGKFCGCELSKLDAKSIVVVGNVYEGVDK